VAAADARNRDLSPLDLHPAHHVRSWHHYRLVARTWLSIRVELVEGRGATCWPRPGRVLAAAKSHTFAELAEAIDDAFARWDRSHLHEFVLADGTRLSAPDPDWDEPDSVLDDGRTTLSRLERGEQFVYTFDLGDDWAHLCTVGEGWIDPIDELGVMPEAPLPYWGWGEIPDQYGRRWDSDDGESPTPPDADLTDLPPLRPGWGPSG
jgi:hypothetical protein